MGASRKGATAAASAGEEKMSWWVVAGSTASLESGIPDPSHPASCLPPPRSSKNATACEVRTLSASPTTIIVGVSIAATSSDQS
jgi:hypothetical protein